MCLEGVKKKERVNSVWGDCGCGVGAFGMIKEKRRYPKEEKDEEGIGFGGGCLGRGDGAGG